MPRVRRRIPSLPAQPNPLIGRERELGAILELLCTPGVRLVTVTGPAGAGKTRLALAAAAESARYAVDGVWFVDLAPVPDPQLVLTAIGRATGVREARGEPAPARIKRQIGQRQVLLLLDNFEQVLSAATDVAGLLAACPKLTILVTSRAPLRLRWEHVFSVPPLAVPESGRRPPPDQLAQVPAVQLYIDRAQAVDPGFRITPQNAGSIAEICVRLDGLPLAIELAAARSDVYAPAEVLTRLRRRLDLLARGAADLPPRQQSLEAAFDWGYELLSPFDRVVFRALGVFVGGFTPEAALAVSGTDDLTILVQHSLARRVAAEDARFGMLETIREYALDRLERAGERPAALERHARFMLDLAERAAPQLLGARQALWLARLEREHDNLSAALRWATAAGELALSLRLARALWRFWWLHGHLSEGMDLLDGVLARTPDVTGDLLALRTAVLNGTGVLAHVRGEYERAIGLVTESLTISRQLGLQSSTAAALHNLGALARERLDWPRARQAYEESLALERESGNRWGIAMSLINLGALAEDQGDAGRAATLLEESLALLREIGDTRGIASALHNLAAVARDHGDWLRAADLNEESLGLWRKLDDRWGTAAALNDLARVVERTGDWRRAASLFGESLRMFGDLGVRQATAGCLEGIAAATAGAGRFQEAARLLGAAEALREQIGVPLPARDRTDLIRTVARVRAGCAAGAFRGAWGKGRALSLDAASAEAQRIVTSLATEQDPTPPLSSLTARESEVVQLIARGLTNRQIAERLVISERTADRHVSNILGKLALNNRAQVAAWLAERGGMGSANTPSYP